jgi:hypothetical protein
MPEPTGRGSREFLPSANQALSELEEATGKPVLIVDAPDLKVLATIRRAGPEDSSHVLRIKGGENRAADYLIVFECRMALRGGPGPRAVLRANPEVRGQVISECVKLHSHLNLAQGRDRKGHFSSCINQQWRICVEWPEKGPIHPIHPGAILVAELQEPNKSVAELAGHGRKAQPPDEGAQGFLSAVILPQLQGLADQADGQTSDV